MKSRLKDIILGSVSFSIFFLLSAWSRQFNFLKSDEVPSAEGTVKISKDRNANYRISLSVSRLARSRQLDPPRKTYVVWADTSRNKVRNIGRLRTSSGLFSNTLKSSLETVSPVKPISIFITAESAVNVQVPQGPVVLRTDKF